MFSSYDAVVGVGGLARHAGENLGRLLFASDFCPEFIDECFLNL